LTQPDRERVIVVGAGAAGLAVALELRRRGIDPLVLEREQTVGKTWRDRYRGLRLNTVRQLSAPRRAPIPRCAGRWVDRTEFAAHLERLARRGGLRLMPGTEAARLEREGSAWAVATADGGLRAGAVVVTTGHDREAKLPDWPGRDRFRGELLHSSAYLDAGDYIDRDVLVVGPGNSGSEIATQLAARGAARVRLAVRTPVNLVPATVLGIPASWVARAAESAPRRAVDIGARAIQRLAFGDLARHGMRRAPRGVATELRERGLGPVLDRGFVGALKRGAIEIIPAVEGFDGSAVRLSGGAMINPDLVIAATGYHPRLEPLVGHLGVLDERGLPLVRDGRGELYGAPGLYFNGYWLPLSGQLPAMRRSSRRIARAIARTEPDRGAPGSTSPGRRRAPSTCTAASSTASRSSS